MHNKSVKPKIEITNSTLKQDVLSFQIFRVEGADVYGSFLIGIKIVDANENMILNLDQNALANFPKENIKNRYVAKIKSGKHSMIIPLGAKANLEIKDEKLAALSNGKYKVILTDISGVTWNDTFEINN